MKGPDLASAMTAPVPGRGAGQPARSASPGVDADADTFGAVLQDVQGAPDAAPGRTSDAGSIAADGTPRDASTGADTPPPAGGADAGAPAAQDPSVSLAPSAAALVTAPSVTFSVQPTGGSNLTAGERTAATASGQIPGLQPGPALPALAPSVGAVAAAPSGQLAGQLATVGAVAGAPSAPIATTVARTASAPLPASPTPVAPTTTPAAASTATRPAVVAVAPASGALAEAEASGPVGIQSVTAVAPADALAVAGSAATATATAGQPTSLAATAPQSSPQAPPQGGPTLPSQLAKPLFTLAGAPQGQHIMTLQLSPDDLGPLTVRAHIDAAGVRIELFAPGDAGREAIRGILPELRKELADAGFGASLDVSEHSGPGNTARDGTGPDPNGKGAGQGGTGRDPGAGPGTGTSPGGQRSGHRWDALADAAALRNARILNGPQTTLDILV
ncbi:flagellar hook-length control protein FliK [Arthrobacter sp. PsM3]|uniref:flagellar hook-length control protein FliK n=1 Tax=Arthrobacter sp. PsM3 TaxID=3030531 RepID=UPI00263A58BA|nr:flagellar hook-length control protein FliK [Arthrobacter sp. PsM3]MDN4642524.1 flagellar hook-length control protein FliK [Arthrobacter sp. PsM3]